MDTLAEHAQKVLNFAHSLIGTSRSTMDSNLIESAGLPDDWDLMNEPMETLREFDDITMMCDGCGWWFETHELNTETSETLCTDCYADLYGDEE